MVGQVAISMPCDQPNPKITSVKPACGDNANSNPPPGPYSIRIQGRGFIPGAAQIVFDVTGSPEAAGYDHRRDEWQAGRDDQPVGTVAECLPLVRGAIECIRVLYQIPFDFTVPCSPNLTPTLTITPGTAAPGFVVQVTGTGFPAGKAVELFWSDGIGAGAPIEVTADADGSFMARQVLIFPHDFAGLRDMTAGTTANHKAFPDATATLLVGFGQGSPPSLTIFGGSPTDQPPIILRR